MALRIVQWNIRWTKAFHPELEKLRKQRETWEAELRKGHNPIDKKTLEALRIED